MDASRTLARQAAAALDSLAFDGTADTPAIAALATRLGVSDRHLRRIFQLEHGVTPLQHLQTRRLLQAKQLLTDSRLPVTQVALASGFRSLRRFNAAFVERYRLSPSELRKGSGLAFCPPARAAADDAVELNLGYRPPFDVPGLLRFFAQRAVPGVESVDEAALQVRRTLRPGPLAPEGGWIEAGFDVRRHRVRLRLPTLLAPRAAAIAQAARRWLDLDADPLAIEAGLAGHDAGDPAADEARPGGRIGTRLPGSLDGFELAVRAVLGQRVTVAGARTLASRLVQAHGEPVVTPFPGLHRLHPSPAVLAAASPDDLGRLGLLRMQVSAIQALARLEPELQAIEHGPAALMLRASTLIERAQVELPGIGDVDGAVHRRCAALRWPDAFPRRRRGRPARLALGVRDANAQPLQSEAEARVASLETMAQPMPWCGLWSDAARACIRYEINSKEVNPTCGGWKVISP